LLYNTDQI
jgi:cyclin-dependent kinase 7